MVEIILGILSIALGLYCFIQGKIPLIKNYNGVKDVKKHLLHGHRSRFTDCSPNTAASIIDWNNYIVSCIFSLLISYVNGNDDWCRCALFNIRSCFESYLKKLMTTKGETMENVIFLAIGLLMLFYAYQLIVKYNIKIMHEYHYQKVNDSQKKAYVQVEGLGLFVMGIDYFLVVLLHILSGKFSAILILLGIVLGIGILIYGQYRYNGSIM